MDEREGPRWEEAGKALGSRPRRWLAGAPAQRRGGGECVSGLRHTEFHGLWDTKWKCPGARTQWSQDWRLRL